MENLQKFQVQVLRSCEHLPEFEAFHSVCWVYLQILINKCTLQNLTLKLYGSFSDVVSIYIHSAKAGKEVHWDCTYRHVWSFGAQVLAAGSEGWPLRGEAGAAPC